MGNMLTEVLGKKCIITVKDISIGPSNKYDMGLFTITADGTNMTDGTELKNIKIEGPKEMIDVSKCVKGAKIEVTLMKSDNDNVYDIASEIKFN